MIDFFENSIFLKDSVREELNKKINMYFEILEKIFALNNSKSGIFYTGSLSRREPAVESSGRLLSDIDLMILKGRDKETWNKDLKHILDLVFPQFNNSVMAFEYKEERKFRSFIGYDLKKMMDKSIFQGEKLPNVQFESIIRRDYFEIIIYQLGNYILNPQYLNIRQKMLLDKNLDYSKMKLVLECLRAQFIYEDNISYNLVYKNRKELAFILDEEVIEEIIYKREHFDSQKRLKVDMVDIVKKAIVRPLGIMVTEESDLESVILEFIKASLEKTEVLMEIFQYQLLCFFFWIKNTKYGKEWKKMLIKSLKMNLKKFPITSKKYSENDIERNIVRNDKIIEVMMALREDYIECMCIKNTGDVSFLDIR